jgi:hypothetical protein
VFDPALLATTYSSDVTDLGGKRTRVVWSLSLTLVDPAGSSPPGNLNSHAAVDEGCNNTKLAGGQSPLGPTLTFWTQLDFTFTWYHGDKGSYAPSTYGCDHTMMGPSGHQGVVTMSVTSSDRKWFCRASIAGTNLGADPIYSGTPTCENLVREHIVAVAAYVKEDIAGEKAALALVGEHSSKATDSLHGFSRKLSELAADLKNSPGAADPIADLRQASKLDEEASKEDVLTNEGAKKAKEDLEAAIALKDKALAALDKLIAAQPTH